MRARAHPESRWEGIWRLERMAFEAGGLRRSIHRATVTLHPEVPEVWDASFAAELKSPLDARALVLSASRALGEIGCGHLKIWLSDPAHRGSIGKALEQEGLVPRPMTLMSVPTLERPSAISEKTRDAVLGVIGTRAVLNEAEHAGPLEIVEVQSSRARHWMAMARDASRRDAPWYSAEVGRSLDRWEDLQAARLPLRWFVAILEAEPAGAVGLLSAPLGASLQSLSTAVHLRHRGIGTALVREVQARAFDLGHRRLSLITDSNSLPQTLYHRLGFSDQGEVVAYQGSR